MTRVIFTVLFTFSPTLLAAQDDWRYVPYFDHPEVQECAKIYAVELAEGAAFSAEEILEEANQFNDFFPIMTKTSDRDTAHIQLSVLSNIWEKARKNIRPGLDFYLHEYGQGVRTKCTFEVFDRHYKNKGLLR